MKVYRCPDEVEAPKMDWRDYDHAKETARQDEHQAKLKAWLIAQGYTGKNTGRILSIHHADGHANYMLAEASKKSCLIHLPYGDGWDSPLASGLTKKAVLEHIERRERLDAFFKRNELPSREA